MARLRRFFSWAPLIFGLVVALGIAVVFITAPRVVMGELVGGDTITVEASRPIDPAAVESALDSSAFRTRLVEACSVLPRVRGTWSPEDLEFAVERRGEEWLAIHYRVPRYSVRRLDLPWLAEPEGRQDPTSSRLNERLDETVRGEIERLVEEVAEEASPGS